MFYEKISNHDSYFHDLLISPHIRHYDTTIKSFLPSLLHLYNDIKCPLDFLNSCKISQNSFYQYFLLLLYYFHSISFSIYSCQLTSPTTNTRPPLLSRIFFWALNLSINSGFVYIRRTESLLLCLISTHLGPTSIILFKLPCNCRARRLSQTSYKPSHPFYY